ncbi:serine/threonine-protein kinase [Polyangium sp. 6x1]|uniref:serine/threonine-protein kinase n=1 Tax=Polyangium sp. 6x1 TaxID=3042689 RepID=UPI0024832371|nr:serine/threonine-protein kinase [Polyangium sp. 6x1]MDI1449896.1 serine/threonine-protein kinase [Polyangium sp. 6x1]
MAEGQECLDENTIVALLGRALPSDRRAAIEAHVDDCEACRVLLAQTTELLLSTALSASRSDAHAPGEEGLGPSTKLGRYVTLQPIGAGAMGVVYAAYDPDLDRKVALKLLRRESGRSAAEMQARLLREAKALARLSHPNVVAIYDVGTVDDRVFIAMEFVTGTTLGAWLREAPRSFPEVLRALLHAGRGLAAAHEAGLVHRDFKPDNVLVGRDGRVRVTDFGLARSSLVEEVATRGEAGAPLPELSQTRAFVGTPAYMAPEQMRGEPIDARADIWSFCATAYEALSGERPFEGDTVEALLEARTAGRVREPRTSRIPPRLRKILLRGMSARPEDRYPTMEALLADLSRDPRATLRRGAAAALVLLVAGAAAAAVSASRGSRAGPEQLCTGGEAHFAAVWQDERSRLLREHFGASGLPFAERASEGVDEAISAYGRAWAGMHRDACEATRIRGEQSEHLLDVRMQCLSRRLREVDAAAGLLVSGDAKVIENALQVVSGLTPVTVCGAAQVLDGEEGSPLQDEARAALDADLARARSLRDAGKYADALDAARAALAGARAKASRGHEAEALLIAGEMTDRLGRIDEGARLLEEAAAVAVEGRMDALGARAMGALIYVVGSRKAQIQAGLSWERLAIATVKRAGAPPLLEAAVLHRAGVTKHAAGMLAEAEADLARVIALREQELGPDHFELAAALADAGRVLRERGERARARSTFERALAIQERSLGPDHPQVATTLRFLADLDGREGHFDDAITRLTRTLVIQERALGPAHLDVAYTQNALANAHLDSGAPDKALPLYERACVMGEKTLGESHPDVGMCRMNVALALIAQGRPKEALVTLERSLVIVEAKLGPTHPNVALIEGTMAHAIEEQGRCAEALPHSRRALAIHEKALGERNAEFADILVGLGRCLSKLGRAHEALPPLERAVSILSSHPGAPAEHARASFTLARALWLVGTKPRALALAEEARRRFAEEPRRRAADLADVDAWLAERRGR